MIQPMTQPAPLTDTKKFYIIDTSFMIDYPSRYQWTAFAKYQIQQPASVIIIPEKVSGEFSNFMKELSLDDLAANPLNVMKRGLGLKSILDYNEELRSALSEKLEKEVHKLGLAEKSLSKTDKTIIQAAYDLSTEGKEVTVITSDEAIHQEVQNLWKTSGLDIKTISPWSAPEKIPKHLLIAENVFSDIPSVAEKCRDYDTFLAVASGLEYGKCGQDIAFGWYINKTHQLFLPRIEGVSYIRMIELPSRMKPQAYKLHTRPKYGFFTAMCPDDLCLVENKRTYTPLEFKKLTDETKNNARIKSRKKGDHSTHVSVNFEINRELINWSRVRTDHFKIHNPLTRGKILELRVKLNGCK